MKEITKKWIDFARADLDAAGIQIQYGKKQGGAYQVAIFHCHQAIEKMLKAHLVEQGQEVKKIHDLTVIRVAIGLDIPKELAKFIDELHPHYLIPRYPDLPLIKNFSFTYNLTNTKDILDKTNRIFIWLEKKLTPGK